jgi:hypothetical protein
MIVSIADFTLLQTASGIPWLRHEFSRHRYNAGTLVHASFERNSNNPTCPRQTQRQGDLLKKAAKSLWLCCADYASESARRYPSLPTGQAAILVGGTGIEPVTPAV